VPNVAPAARAAHGASSGAAPLLAGGGRLSPQKDPDFFLTAVRRLRATHPDLRAVWLGDGNADDRETLRAAGVEVSGWLPRHEALDLLARADLYLHSALWEGFPLMVAEAVALGVPTLVRRVPSFDDVPAELALPGTDLGAAVACLTDPRVAADNLGGWRGMLAHNTAADQRGALLDVYLGRPAHRPAPIGD
jgi:hypothetical protein